MMYKRTLYAVWGLAVLLLVGSVRAQDNGPSYQVDFADAINHYVTVTMTAEVDGGAVQIMLPTWTPGSYMIREYAKSIDRIGAVDSSGNELPIEKISKNRWQIEAGDAKKIKVTYRVYCNERSVRTNWVGVGYGVLNGAATFVTIPEQIDRPHRVALRLPKGWQRSATALRPEGKLPNRYRADSYHELVDSPIVAGRLDVHSFVVAGVEHFLVNVNPANDIDGDRATEDLGKIINEHHEVWGTVPYDRYYFINVNTNGGGGLEHDNCCLLMSTQLDTRDKAAYKSWLGLCSHEFFHAWNVRRLRPKALVNYDYEAEVYTPSLWIAEGFTSYYEDLLVARAGLLTQDEFIRKLSGQIESLQRTEGRLVQSLRDASHDAWIKYYRPSPNSRDTQISYYTKGAVVGFLLDVEIRRATDGQKSLDDVLRLMYERFAASGYTPEDFQNVCNEVAGADLSAWFQRAVESTDELDYQPAADWFGLAIGEIVPQQVAAEPAPEPTPEPAPAASKEPPAADGSDAPPQESSDGTIPTSIPTSARMWQEPVADPAAQRPGRGTRRRSFGNANAESTQESDGESSKKPKRWLGIGEPDSPATKVGLADTDEILAVNGTRLEGDIEARVQDFEVGDPLKILIARDKQILEILVAVGELKPQPNWSVRIAPEASEAQKTRIGRWLHQETKPE